MPVEFVGKSEPISRDGLAAVADALSVKAAEIWAVLAVETSGCGYIADRRPQILFERHIFHKLTNGAFDDGDISDPKPGGYGPSGTHQYGRLAQAIAKDRTAALKSASWGLGQVLGTNFAASGFADVEIMVSTLIDSEDAQLAAMASFLKESRLDAALRAHDWTSFARGYNGPGFAKNNYDTRLRGEFNKFTFGPLPDLQLRAAQLFLTFAGFHPGPVDGVMGSQTRAALTDFQSGNGLDPTGEVDDETLAALREAALS